MEWYRASNPIAAGSSPVAPATSKTSETTLGNTTPGLMDSLQPSKLDERGSIPRLGATLKRQLPEIQATSTFLKRVFRKSI